VKRGPPASSPREAQLWPGLTCGPAALPSKPPPLPHPHPPGQASVCSLLLACPPYAVAPTGFVWLQAPAIDRLQWHPLEYVAVPSGAPGGGGEGAGAVAMLIHAKAYDR
jgi:hypothetical protein